MTTSYGDFFSISCGKSLEEETRKSTNPKPTTPKGLSKQMMSDIKDLKYRVDIIEDNIYDLCRHLTKDKQTNKQTNTSIAVASAAYLVPEIEPVITGTLPVIN